MAEVQLYVYDLSKGLARQMSMQFLGTQIDAVYHTAIVINGVEYFYGAGIQMTSAGQTHHGRPMEVISLGRTDLPEDIVLEYLNSLRDIYTPESYDLFAHNCNNFTQDFATFLMGKGIPDHITSLPKTVLDTPFGQMLRPQLDRSMRGITQAPVPPPSRSATSAASNGSALGTRGVSSTPAVGSVKNLTSISEIESIVRSAPASVIFFTSATCAPCKIAYPVYDELAEEAGAKCTLIKVDINEAAARAAASKYAIRATPTFMTFLHGKKEEEWAGADPSRLRGTVRMLVQTAFPPHPHERLRLTSFSRASRAPALYAKVPPLDKLTAKMGPKAPAARTAVDFIAARANEGAKEAPLPDLGAIGFFFQSCADELPLEVLFAAYDLFRAMLVDPRVSAFFAEQKQPSVVQKLMERVNGAEVCPYNLRLVSIHLACNFFSSPVARHALPDCAALCSAMTTLVADSLLDREHANLRVAAASLAYNLASAEYEAKLGGRTAALSDSVQVELAAALIEALSSETESPEAARGMALSLGRLLFKADITGELAETCVALEAPRVVKEKESVVSKDDRALVKEIAEELLGKGLKSP